MAIEMFQGVLPVPQSYFRMDFSNRKKGIENGYRGQDRVYRSLIILLKAYFRLILL